MGCAKSVFDDHGWLGRQCCAVAPGTITREARRARCAVRRSDVMRAGIEHPLLLLHFAVVQAIDRVKVSLAVVRRL